MSVKRMNLLKPVFDLVIQRLKEDDRDIVWYGGRQTMSIMNDSIKIFGRHIKYAIFDEEPFGELKLNYAWNIPLVNRYIHVDISKSKILSQYHLHTPAPEARHFSVSKQLGNRGVYFISSERADSMINNLEELGINRENICILPSDNTCMLLNKEKEDCCFNTMRELKTEEIQKIEFQILVQFKDFCERHNLRYLLAGGTMLGAIRHNGFIPWDDDIDVYMPDSDYKKLVELYKDDDDFELLHYTRDSSYPFYFAKLTKKRTAISHGGYPVHYIMGIYIDIFPLVGFPDSESEQKLQWENEHITMAEWYWYQDLVDLIGTSHMPISKENILQGLKTIPFDNANMIGPVSVILQKEWLSRYSDFNETIEKRFMDGIFRIPAGYDQHLTLRYGNYMELPPEGKRVVHGFPAYMEK